MLSKRYESTEVDRKTWLHVPSGTHWFISSDTHQVVEIQIEASTKMYTPFLFRREIQNEIFLPTVGFEPGTFSLRSRRVVVQVNLNSTLG